MTLLPLIRKLKEAREPSRELDEDIALACEIWRPWLSKHRYWNFTDPHSPTKKAVEFSWPQTPVPNFDPETGKKNELDETPPHGWCWEAHLPEYTKDIHAALTLLRKHYMWQLKRGIECEAIVWWLEKDWDDTGAPTARQLPEYPALALTTAILIARAVEDREIHPGDEI